MHIRIWFLISTGRLYLFNFTKAIFIQTNWMFVIVLQTNPSIKLHKWPQNLFNMKVNGPGSHCVIRFFSKDIWLYKQNLLTTRRFYQYQTHGRHGLTLCGVCTCTQHSYIYDIFLYNNCSKWLVRNIRKKARNYNCTCRFPIPTSDL